jgi:SAM-dependent methyltransferase
LAEPTPLLGDSLCRGSGLCAGRGDVQQGGIIGGNDDPGIVGESLNSSHATVNRELYEQLWEKSRIRPPAARSVWPVVRDLLPASGRVLEIGAGTRPRVPIAGSFFVDLSREAGRALAPLGAKAVVADAGCLPFCSSSFELIVAAEVLEHINDDQGALEEWNRVLKPGGRLFLSVPLYRHMWTVLDPMVGHVRRYEPADLQVQLERSGFQVDRYATDRIALYRGTNRLAALGMALLSPRFVIWVEERVLAPVAEKLAQRRACRFDWREKLAQEKDMKATSALVICTCL